LSFDPARPPVSLVARPLADASATLPLVGTLHRPRTTLPAVYVSESMAALYGAEAGRSLALPIPGRSEPLDVEVLGVWRDYARQFGAVAIDLDAYRELTGDTRLNDLALWLQPGASMADVQAALRALASDEALIEFAQPAQLRARSLAIFDRSFAVTYYLQALAILIGLFGIAASFSAQVLARRREFGLLAHLGLRRAQIVAVVAGEGAAWTAAGALLGLALGLAVSVVLVHVVNPQSFHWTMDLSLPAGRLLLLFAAVMLTGIATAVLAARQALSRAAVLAVKEDW
jgi:putative ABC transport system permease protein